MCGVTLTKNNHITRGARALSPVQKAHDSRWEYERGFSPNYYTRQTGKAIIDYHEEFEQAQNEW